MDFTSYAKKDSINVTETKTQNAKNYDHFVDPYIRRYHINKIAVKSLSLGLLVYMAKSIAENL